MKRIDQCRKQMVQSIKVLERTQAVAQKKLELMSALQLIFFFLQENKLRRALNPFIGVRFINGIRGRKEMEKNVQVISERPLKNNPWNPPL